MTTRDPLRGFLYALAHTALVSTNFVTAKYALEGFNAETFSTVWTGAGAIFALFIVLGTGQARDLKLSRTALVHVLAMGVLTGAGMVLTWAGLQRLDPGFAAFLWRFMPVLILLFGFLFLREKVGGMELLPLALMIGGGVVSVVGRWEVVGTGVILTLLAAVAGAGQMLFAKILVKKHGPNAVVFLRLFYGALFIALWTVGAGRFDGHVPLKYWGVTLLGALLGPVLSHVLLFRSYRHWELSRSGIVMASQPLFVIPMAFLFLGKFPADRALLGGAAILAGAFWLAAIHLKKKADRPPAVVA